MFEITKVTFRAGENGETRSVLLASDIPNGVAEWLTFDRGEGWTGTDGTIEKVIVYEGLNEIPKGFKVGMHDPESYTRSRIKRLADPVIELMNKLSKDDKELLPRVLEFIKEKTKPSE